MRRVVKLKVQPNNREGAVARRIASAVLQDDHANAKEIADVELATSELVTNAVEASTGSDALSISMELSDDDVRVSVTNQGETPVFLSECRGVGRTKDSGSGDRSGARRTLQGLRKLV